MEVSGHLHAAAALPPGKEPSVPIGYEVEWAPQPFRHGVEEKNSQPPSGFEPRSSDRPTDIKRNTLIKQRINVVNAYRTLV
jgi:hypothetical protein